MQRTRPGAKIVDVASEPRQQRGVLEALDRLSDELRVRNAQEVPSAGALEGPVQLRGWQSITAEAMPWSLATYQGVSFAPAQARNSHQIAGSAPRRTMSRKTLGGTLTWSRKKREKCAGAAKPRRMPISAKVSSVRTIASTACSIRIALRKT